VGASEKRILIDPKEDVSGKINQYSLENPKIAKNVLSHLRSMVVSFENVFGTVGGDTLEEKISRISSMFFK
jgi:hypothetical protein